MILKADVVTSFESGMPLDGPESGAIVGKVTTPDEQSVGVIENEYDDSGIIDSDEPRPMVEIVTIHDEGVM
jgi:hypothetical protein